MIDTFDDVPIQTLTVAGVTAGAAILNVPPTKQWKLIALRVIMNSVAVPVGNRLLQITINSFGYIPALYAGVVQPLGVGWVYNIFPGAPLSAAPFGVAQPTVYMPLPRDLVLDGSGGGSVIQVSDAESTSVALDTYTLTAVFKQRGP